jgi:predicted anti-sigma-YlaC factor YlaD
MSCKTYKEMLHSYTNSELSPLDTKAVSDHLATCTDCHREVAEIRKLKAILAEARPDRIELLGLKESIMTAIRITKKVRTAAFDIKVMSRLATSLIACGLLVFFMSFTTLGSSLEAQSNKINIDISGLSQKIVQPIALINKGLQDMSSKLVDLNGITFRLQQKIRGGM